MKKYIKAKDVKKLYAGTSEFSLIDIREIGQHTDGHPFFSISIPYSIFENRIIDLIPSKETLIILNIAKRLCNLLKRKDPLEKKIKLSRIDLIFCFFKGIMYD